MVTTVGWVVAALLLVACLYLRVERDDAREELESATFCERPDVLHAFIDDELDERSTEQFRAHLGRCDECALEMHDQMQLKALVQKARPQEGRS